MQIKFLTLGFLFAALTLVSADAVKAKDITIKAKNTGSCIAKNIKVKKVLNNLDVNVAGDKKRSLRRRRANI
ncbi:hypothetical protein [Parasitella parasitica]|uniref:Uncharacterized protein n=1 Tax=Parasitella parasitica TaxID=35722 RepID=A0A0B7MW98_9FUNG|nr:hypothetical protein [Parasitella parasitica]